MKGKYSKKYCIIVKAYTASILNEFVLKINNAQKVVVHV
jgi:hypothetical protein